MLEHFGSGPGCRLARKHLAWYSQGLPGSAEYRAAVTRVPDAEAARSLVNAFYDGLAARGVERQSRAFRAAAGGQAASEQVAWAA